MSRIAIALCVMLVAGAVTRPASAQPVTFAAGSHVEGHVGSTWVPCTTVGSQLPTGGYVLRCASLPGQEGVFSESDVRTPQNAPPPAAKNVAPPAQGTRVEGHVGNHWEKCTQLGGQLATGGYLLRCDSTPTDESVFSATDVRPIRVAGKPKKKPPVAANEHRVDGHVNNHWEPCTQIGGQVPTGGYSLRCDSTPNITSVFSATDVREIGAPQPPANNPPAAVQGRPVQGHVGNHWENCTMIGKQLPTGGYLLRCESTPNTDSVFSATDVRF